MRRVVEGGYPEFKYKVSAFPVVEIVVVSLMSPGKPADPGIAAPDHAPLVIDWRGEDVIVLGVDTAETEIVFNGIVDQGIDDELAAGYVRIE